MNFSLLLSGKQKIIDSQIVSSAQLSEVMNAGQAAGCCLNAESKLWTHKKTEIPVYLFQSYMSFQGVTYMYFIQSNSTPPLIGKNHHILLTFITSYVVFWVAKENRTISSWRKSQGPFSGPFLKYIKPK